MGGQRRQYPCSRQRRRIPVCDGTSTLQPPWRIDRSQGAKKLCNQGKLAYLSRKDRGFEGGRRKINSAQTAKIPTAKIPPKECANRDAKVRNAFAIVLSENKAAALMWCSPAKKTAIATNNPPKTTVYRIGAKRTRRRHAPLFFSFSNKSSPSKPKHAPPKK